MTDKAYAKYISEMSAEEVREYFDEINDKCLLQAGTAFIFWVFLISVADLFS